MSIYARGGTGVLAGRDGDLRRRRQCAVLSLRYLSRVKLRRIGDAEYVYLAERGADERRVALIFGSVPPITGLNAPEQNRTMRPSTSRTSRPVAAASSMADAYRRMLGQRQLIAERYECHHDIMMKHTPIDTMKTKACYSRR